MSFASAYIKKNILFSQFIDDKPETDTGIIVVIPSYGESNINSVTDSLAAADKPDCNVEVIITVNAPQNAPQWSIEKNKDTLSDIEYRRRNDKNLWFRLFSLDIKQGTIPDWGVGLARKTGMDEALRRFNAIDNKHGIIACLDADCKVEKNYFSAINDQFVKQKKLNACSIYFEHDIRGSEFPEPAYKNILQYELHLRYLIQGLKFSGCPWAFHTVGSSMAVRANQYALQGGMNRRQAGEDFYFIQKMISAGGYFSLSSTTVYPSSRTSFRVPFGTGAAMEKLCSESDSQFMTYSPAAFEELRKLFLMAESLYGCSETELINSYYNLPEGIKLYLKKEEWTLKIIEIKGNTSNVQAFRKRFYNWFNMFRIVRYLNTVHAGLLAKMPVIDAATVFLQNLPNGYNGNSSEDLLIYYRKLEKGN